MRGGTINNRLDRQWGTLPTGHGQTCGACGAAARRCRRRRYGTHVGFQLVSAQPSATGWQISHCWTPCCALQGIPLTISTGPPYPLFRAQLLVTLLACPRPSAGSACARQGLGRRRFVAACAGQRAARKEREQQLLNKHKIARGSQPCVSTVQRPRAAPWLRRGTTQKAAAGTLAVTTVLAGLSRAHKIHKSPV